MIIFSKFQNKLLSGRQSVTSSDLSVTWSNQNVISSNQNVISSNQNVISSNQNVISSEVERSLHAVSDGTLVEMTSERAGKLIIKCLVFFLLTLTCTLSFAAVSQGTKLRNVIVVIDPGHGGKDPGATGPKGVHEKNVVLAISRDLEKDIDQVPGMAGTLTRKGDYFIPLRTRLRIARMKHADIFIAIHADAFKNRSANGASVFALSERGASSEAARWLARRENNSELMGGISLQDKTYLLKSVLLDLSQSATIHRSLKLGSYVLSQLGRVTTLHKNKVEQAPFVVLKSPDIPSILVETGFISNPRQEYLLNNKWFQKRIAYAMFKGVKQYFNQYPPKYTWLAYRKKGSIKYRVKKGDTLIKLAQQQKTTVGVIKQINHLKSSRIYVDQALTLPK